MTTNKPEVKRHSPAYSVDSVMRGHLFMEECEHGAWVSLEDYEALQAECEELRAAMIEAKTYIDHYMYGGSTYREPAAQAIALIDAAMQGDKP